VASGRTYFRGLLFDDLRRMQFDLETTGLDPETGRIFLVAVRDPEGRVQILEAADAGDAAEYELIQRLCASVRTADPDVIENHNLHGFDLPFLAARAQRLGVPLDLGRSDGRVRAATEALGARREPGNAALAVHSAGARDDRHARRRAAARLLRA
jgi:DNA polymerase I